VVTNDLSTSLREQVRSPGPVEADSALNPNRAFSKNPRKRATSKQPSTRKQKTRATKRSILVVDDVTDVTEMIALFLKHAGYDVMTANEPNTALEIAAEKTFDLVISDIGMPDMNGYELAASLRGRADYRATPLIAVTGYTEYDDRGRSLRAGFDAHLTKPINPPQLLKMIEELLD
jgi:CheY-like chemotaxis protein